jgi:uncharacterized protein
MATTISHPIFNPDTIDIVLYHGQCHDGFGSAFIIWLYYKNKYGLEKANQITYIPCYHDSRSRINTDFYKKFVNKNVIMCDFTFKYPIMKKIIETASSFIVLDHHKTAETELSEIDDQHKIFDMNRSGVGITWDFFFPGQTLYPFLANVQDRDLWLYNIDTTMAFTTFFYEQKMIFDKWEEMLNEDNYQKAIVTGDAWNIYKKMIIDRIVNRCSYITQMIDNQLCVVLYSNSIEFKSEIGNQLFNRVPIGDFSCVWHYDAYYDRSSYSLRSTEDRFDVSKIASKHGGGGHRNAAGCVFDGCVGKLPYEIVKCPDGLIEALIPKVDGITANGLQYTTLCVKEFKEEYIQEPFYSFIERKCPGKSIITFSHQGTINSVVCYQLTICKRHNTITPEGDNVSSILIQTNTIDNKPDAIGEAIVDITMNGGLF